MLGRIHSVALRTVWRHEATDFTPWLAENTDLLAEVIGIELEVENTEVPVGPYYADILAKDAGSGHYVVIENQLEKTNHDHLGKCITYASVLDAKSIVWIASEFTDEHRKAMDWLNDHTSDDISFFAVNLELIRIDDSIPAVNFNIQSEPNDVVKQAVKQKDIGNLSEAKRTQLQFWEKFKESLEARKILPRLQTPRPQYWFDVTLGKAGIHLSNTFNTHQNRIGVRVYISNQQAEEWYPYLESYRDDIEQQLGEKLSWNPNPENRDKVITLTKDFELSDPSKWHDPINWLTDKTVEFHRIFSDVIQQGKQEIQ